MPQPGNQDSPARLRLLMTGPLPPPQGGASVSFLELLRRLEREPSTEVRCIDSGRLRRQGLRGLPRLLGLLLRFHREAQACDVACLHCSCTGLSSLGLAALLLCRLARRPLAIRQFGGADPAALPQPHRALALWTLARCDLYFVQTRALEAAVRRRGIEPTRLLPTARPLPPEAERRAPGGPCRRFVFAGQLRPDKGLREIRALDGRLPGDVTVDIYGPETEDLRADFFDGCRQLRYRGAFEPGQAAAVLARYDALLLPTYYPGEGYPGVVVEAYMAGIPVVCTDWMALPEIVGEDSGLLLPPRDAEALLEALRRLAGDDALYHRLCQGARRRAEVFSIDTQAETLLAECRRLAHR